MIFVRHPLAARQKPAPGERLAQPIAGGFWLPGMQACVPDAAGCNAPATIIGGVTRVQGPFGGPALKFDNSSGYVDCALNGNNAFNWSTGVPIKRSFWAWVRRPTSSSVGPVFAKGNNTPNSGWNLSITTTGMTVGWIGASNGQVLTTNILSAGDWHHVMVAWDGVSGGSPLALGSMSIYLNGQPQTGTGSWPGVGQNSTDSFNLWIGHSAYVGSGGGAVSAYADLEIDHWGFDHRVYSQEEANDLYLRPFRNFAPAPYFRRSLAGGSVVARPRIFVCT